MRSSGYFARMSPSEAICSTASGLSTSLPVVKSRSSFSFTKIPLAVREASASFAFSSAACLSSRLPAAPPATAPTAAPTAAPFHPPSAPPTTVPVAPPAPAPTAVRVPGVAHAAASAAAKAIARVAFFMLPPSAPKNARRLRNHHGQALAGTAAGTVPLACKWDPCEGHAPQRGGSCMLQVGDVAPDFELLDEEGKPTRLSGLRGRNVVLLFFPAAFSPICTQELKQIAARDADYDRQNARVLAVSVDNKWSLKAFKRDQALTATLLSDFHPKGNVAQKYGVFMGETGYAKRGTFVIDKEGVIRGISVKEPKEPRSEEDYFNQLRNCPR